MSDIHFGYKTDHSLVSLALSRFNQNRGPGFWKLNTSLLTNTDNVVIIRNEIITRTSIRQKVFPTIRLSL